MSSPDSQDASKPTEFGDLLARIQVLSEAVEARDSFLAIAAHELRNPMTPIMGQVQRLHRLVKARRCDLEEVDKSLGLISWLVELYVKRANVLLDVSRITTGKLTLLPERFDAADLVRHVVSAHELAAQHAKCTLTAHAPTVFEVTNDRLALEQIVDNLLLNAIRYGAGHPVIVGLSGDDTTLSISIRDHGIGISDIAKKRIFERFERAVRSNTEGGFGVGLWVVAQLVDTMRGSIRIESLSPGTEFVVTLPRTITPTP